MPFAELMAMRRVTDSSCSNAYGAGTRLRRSSFVPAVRAFHLARLPSFDSAFAGHTCAYCGTETGRRSMRIDHIIPVRIYCRFKLLGDPRVAAATDARMGQLVDEHHSDGDNLLLACQRCNGIKSEAMPDTVQNGATWLERAEHYLPDAVMGDIVDDRQSDCDTILRLSAARQRFVLHGTGANTSIMGTRKRRRDTTPERWLKIQRAIINRLATSRPDHGWGAADLEDTQVPAHPVGRRDLKLCLYCLGLFMDQAFELDHIRPVNRSRTSASLSARAYNDPTNIVAVCGSCNGSKSNAGVSRGWLQTRFDGRVTEGLPGLEGVLSASQLRRARAKRDRLLGM